MQNKPLKVALSAPVDDNLYSLLVSQLCINERDVKIVGVITLKLLSLKRIKQQIKRFGFTLLRKVWEKYLINNNIDNDNSAVNSLIKKSRLLYQSHNKLCNNYGTPLVKVNSPNDYKAIKFFQRQKPDIILSIGSDIIRQPFLNIPLIGVFNVHMGILPNYRGIGVTEWPIIENKLEDIGLGVTLHLMEKGVDTGPILIKKRISIKKGDQINNIENKYLPEMVKTMLLGVKMARDGSLKPTPQKKADGRQYFSLHKRMKTVVKKRIENLF